MKRRNKPKDLVVIIEHNNWNEFGGKICNPRFDNEIDPDYIRKKVTMIRRKKQEPKLECFDLLITLIESGKFTRDQIMERVMRRTKTDKPLTRTK